MFLGNTGAGKTHTMIGSPSEPGIMVRTMNDLFLYTEKNAKALGVVFKVRVSFLEVGAGLLNNCGSNRCNRYTTKTSRIFSAM